MSKHKSSKQKKKKHSHAPAPQSEKSYLQSGRARSLPIHKCLVTKDWKKTDMAQVIVARRHVNGHVTVGAYLIDLLCAGVKDSFYLFNIPEFEFNEDIVFSPGNLEECSYELAHNIIYGAVAFAREYGIEPPADFQLTQQILEEDTEEIELIEIAFGREGRPVLMLNTEDPRLDYYRRQLEKYAGPGSYDVEGMAPLAKLTGDLEGDLEEEYYLYPEEWDALDWEDFIDETKPEELVLFSAQALYIYEQLVYQPAIVSSPLLSAISLQKVSITYEWAEELPYHHSSQEIKELQKARKIIDTKQVAKAELEALARTLQEDIVRWPQNPDFWSCLGQVYERLEKNKEAEEIFATLPEKFPAYTIGKAEYAERLVLDEKLEQVPPLFDNHFDLPGAFPDRTVFHITEVLSFYYAMCMYFLRKGELLNAYCYYKTIYNLELAEDFASFGMLELILKVDIIKAMKKELEGARKHKKKKEALISRLLPETDEETG